ncbi:MAG: restriction endonuclease subunit S [Lachnospiraceae bacterium]|nr:restriction endonuclease subunit S [Lachnospiraceae bacterium]
MSNIPKVRFKGFTDDWEQCKVLDIAPLQRGFDLPTSQMENGDYPVVMSNGIGGYHNEYKVKGPGVVTGRSGTIGKVHYIESDYWPHNTSLWVTDFKGNEPKFIYHLYQWLDLSKFGTGSGVPTLNRNDVHDSKVFIPSVGEQRKISEYFDRLDNLITLHQRKCEAIKKYKTGVLQKMFPRDGEKTPEIRFPGFTDAWEQRKLSDFGKATGGTSIESEFSEDGIYKVISIGSYSEDSVYRDQGIRAIESDKTKNRVLNKDDLTMILNDKTASGNIIGRALLIEESGVYVYNQRTERIEIDHDNYDSLFLYEMLNAPSIRDKIIKQSQGNTQIYVNWPTISMTEYLVPKIEEQRKLGAYFKNLDNLITLHQRKCDFMKELKKGLFQQMFV